MTKIEKKSSLTLSIDIVVVIIAALYGLFLSGEGIAWHEDDAPRNYSGIAWDHDGRPVASLLYKAYSLSGIINMSPLTQVLSCIMVAVAGLLILKKFSPKASGWFLLSALLPLFSPLYVRNIFYVFDCLTMSAALLAGAAAYWVISNNSWNLILRVTVSSVTLGLAFLSYQAAILVFLSCTIFEVWQSLIIGSDPIKEIAKKASFFVLSLIIGLAIHHCFFHPTGWGKDHSGFVDFKHLSLVWDHLKRWVLHLENNLSGTMFVGTKIILALGALSFVFLVVVSKRPVWLKIVLLETFPVCLILMFFGPLFLLSNPYFDNRFLFSFGFVNLFSILLLKWSISRFFNGALPGRVAVFCTCSLLWFSTLNAVQFHNALAAQRYYVDTVSNQAAPILNKLLVDNPKATLISMGNFRRCYQLRKYEAVNGILRSMWLGDIDFYAPYLSQRFNLGDGAFRWKYSRENIPTKEVTTDKETPDYAIYHDATRVWIKLPRESGNSW